MLKKNDKLVNEAYKQLMVENEEALTDAIGLVNSKLVEMKTDLEKILKKNNVESALLVADDIIDQLSIAMKPIIKDALSNSSEVEEEEEEIIDDNEFADDIDAEGAGLPEDLPEL